MRSYYAHLETTAKKAADSPIEPRPVFRTSAIFPVFHEKGITSRILFMGYWLLKRNILELHSVITLRSEEGAILARRSLVVNKARAYQIELDSMLETARIPVENPFHGSLEVEFFSNTNLVFPYPAVVINYYGPNFSTVVHTAQRVYNDFEDMQNNSQTEVPESGFNIYKDNEREPFLALINGGQAVPDSKMDFIFYNSKGETLNQTYHIGNFAPYQTLFVYPAKEFPLEEFLGGQVGTCKVYFHLNWIFPRLIVGNLLNHPKALIITHTYYDCTNATQPSNYWKFSNPDYYPESLMIPMIQSEETFTKIYFYPIYSPSHFTIDIEVYDQNGTQLGAIPSYLKITSPSNNFISISFKDVLERLKITTDKPLAARIIAKSIEGEKLPTRIKLALDIGSIKETLPCNICTNLQPYNPGFDGKKQSFKWGPILADQPNSSAWIMNSQPRINYSSEAEIQVNFYRAQDTETIERKIKLPPEGFIIIEPDKDTELKTFFQGQIGWFTAISSNPYTTTFYFSQNRSGVVGGDHGF